MSPYQQAQAENVWWSGDVDSDVMNQANWALEEDEGTTIPSGKPSRDIVRIGATWGRPAPGVIDGVTTDPVGFGGWGHAAGWWDVDNDPVLDTTFMNRHDGTADAGWWFVLGAPNTLTLEDGAYLRLSHADSNIRNGGELYVKGRSASNGPSLEGALRFRIAENGSIAGASTVTSLLQIEGNGWADFSEEHRISGNSSGNLYIGTDEKSDETPRGEIRIRDTGRLSLRTGQAAGGNTTVVPFIDFGNTDTIVNQVIIEDAGELWLADPNRAGAVDGEDKTIQELIDGGYIVYNGVGTFHISSTANPTVIRVAGAGDVVTLSLGGVAADVESGSIEEAIDLVNDGGNVEIVEAGTYAPFTYFGNKVVGVKATVDGVTIVSNTDAPAVTVKASSSTLMASLGLENLDIETSGSADSVFVEQTTNSLTVSLTDVSVFSGGNGNGPAVTVRSANNEGGFGHTILNLSRCDLSTTGSQSPLAFSTSTTHGQIQVFATDTDFTCLGSGSPIGATTNRRWDNVDMTLTRCDLETMSGKGIHWQGNNIMRQCQMVVDQSSILCGGGNNEAILMQNSATASSTGNSLTVTRSILDTGATDQQGRVIRCNISTGIEEGSSVAASLTVTNSVIITAGADPAQITGDGLAGQNHSMGIGSENNVSMNARHNTIISRNRIGWGAVWHNSYPPATIANNIFWNFGGQSGHYSNKGGTGVLANDRNAPLTLSGNLVAGTTLDSDVAPTEEYLVPLDSVFEDPDNSDFLLRWTPPSTALGGNVFHAPTATLGTLPLGVGSDILGNSRPTGSGAHPDAGAYESELVPVELSTFSVE